MDGACVWFHNHRLAECFFWGGRTLGGAYGMRSMLEMSRIRKQDMLQSYQSRSTMILSLEVLITWADITLDGKVV